MLSAVAKFPCIGFAVKSANALAAGSIKILTASGVIVSTGVPVFSATAGMIGDSVAVGSAVAISAGDEFVVEVGATGVVTSGSGTLASLVLVDTVVSKPDAVYNTGSCNAVSKDTISLATGGKAAAMSAVRDNCTDGEGLVVVRLCIA